MVVVDEKHRSAASLRYFEDDENGLVIASDYGSDLFWEFLRESGRLEEK